MTRINGTAATANAAKYIRQLCSHWGHKLAIEQNESGAVVHFPNGDATLTADASGIAIATDGADPEAAEKLQGVVAAHLDRFAFREAPLDYRWTNEQPRL